MSRSNPGAESTHPTQRFFSWAGSVGRVTYYDKAEEQNIEQPLPFVFLVLDTLSCIVGFMKGKGGFWSNEIRSTQTDKLVVRSKGNIEFEGLYADMNVAGAKYASSVYIAYKDGDDLKIGNIKFSGAAISSWIDFSKQHNLNKIGVAITGAIHGKNGAVEYEKPIFAAVDVDPETDKKAAQLDEILQPYLTASLNRVSSAPQRVQREVATQEQEDASSEVEAPPAAPARPTRASDNELDLSKIKF